MIPSCRDVLLSLNNSGLCKVPDLDYASYACLNIFLTQRSILMDRLHAFEDAMLYSDSYMQCKEIDFMEISEGSLRNFSHH